MSLYIIPCPPCFCVYCALIPIYPHYLLCSFLSMLYYFIDLLYPLMSLWCLLRCFSQPSTGGNQCTLKNVHWKGPTDILRWEKKIFWQPASLGQSTSTPDFFCAHWLHLSALCTHSWSVLLLYEWFHYSPILDTLEVTDKEDTSISVSFKWYMVAWPLIQAFTNTSVILEREGMHKCLMEFMGIKISIKSLHNVASGVVLIVTVATDIFVFYIVFLCPSLHGRKHPSTPRTRLILTFLSVETKIPTGKER